MKCPSCQKNITKISRKCVSCDYIYGIELYKRLRMYFEIEEGMHDFCNLIDNGLKNIVHRMNSYESLLNSELENLGKGLNETPPDEKSTSTVSPPKEVKEVVPNIYNDVAPKKFEDVAPKTHKRPAAKIEQEPKKANFYMDTHARRKKEATPSALEEIKAKITASKSNTKKRGLDFEVNLGQKWLLIIGIITTVIGVGYFLKYSFDKGWVGPAGRVAMAYAWGMGFLVAGNHFRKNKYELYGLSLIGGGIAILYFSAFAAFNIYHLFGQPVTFCIMVMITTLACVLSIVYDTKWLAILGLIGGFFTPLMISTGVDNQIFLMSYMTILNVGLLGIAFYKRWEILNILGLFFTYILYAGWFAKYYSDPKFWAAIIFLNIFNLIYSVAPFAYDFFKSMRDDISIKPSSTVIVFLNSIAYVAYSFFMIKEHVSVEWVGVATILSSLIFLIQASYLYKKNVYKQDAFVILLGMASMFLILTVPIVFSQHWITIFFLAQSLVLLWMGIKLSKKGFVSAAIMLMLFALFKLITHDQPVLFKVYDAMIPYSHMIVERCVTTLMALTTFYYFTKMLNKVPELLDFIPNEKHSYQLMSIWGCLLFFFANVEVSAFFTDYLHDAHFAAISILWTISSIVLMLLGFRYNNGSIRKTALALFCVTLLKVFMFDMSKVGTPYRILSFIILGVVLIMASYLYHKSKDKILEALKK